MKVIQDLGSKVPANSRSKTPRKRKHLLVECSCGTQWEVLAENYNAGKVTMCKGCQNRIVSKAVDKGQGYKGRKPSYLRTAYNNMLDRCYKPSKIAYKDYGAKGVTVCNEWLDRKTGFKAFKEWSESNGYQEGLVCDKDYLCDKLGISPKIYSPNTCTWMTREENSALTSKLTNEQQLELVAKYPETSIKELAKEYGYTYQGILYILEKHKAYQRTPNKRTKNITSDTE